MTKQYQKDARTKVNFIESQIANIENTLDDVKFTQVVKESNRAIENLSKQIDTDEIRIAKELQEEGKMRREEIEAMLEDDEDDQAIKEELDLIERGMLEENFDAAEARVKRSGTNIGKVGALKAENVQVEKRQAMLN